MASASTSTSASLALSDRRLEAQLRLEARIKTALLEAFPGAIAAHVEEFARDNVTSSATRFVRELNVFIEKRIWLALPEIPQESPEGWKFHRRAPLRTFNEDDAAEKHMCVAEAAVLSVMRPTEADNYIIDVVENNALKRDFLAMKSEMAADGKDPLELLLFHGTSLNNVNPILSGNFDPNCIRRKAFGHGFYFSEFPATSLAYGSSLIFCRVMPGKAQIDGGTFQPETYVEGKSEGSPDQQANISTQLFDSFQVPEGMDYAEGVPANMHVIKLREQILPICVIHLKTPVPGTGSLSGQLPGWVPELTPSLWPANGAYTLHRVEDFSSFDENDKAQMTARIVLSRLLRLNQRPGHVNVYGAQASQAGTSRWPNQQPGSRVTLGHVMSSVVYVENEEASSAFQSMKEQLAEDRASTMEILLFHHVNVWGPRFFSKSEFASSDQLKSDLFGEGFMLNDWLDLNLPHDSIVVVYRVLLGRMQTKGEKLDPSTYNSFRVKRILVENKEQYTYVVSSEYQLLPYCVAVIKNDESRRNIISKIMPKVEAHLRYEAEPASIETACLVCKRTDLDLSEWFGCVTACSLCADFFRRTCIGSNFFVRPETCLYRYMCSIVFRCRACRLRSCLEAGMTAASLASHFGVSEVHRDDIAEQLQDFKDSVRKALEQYA